MDLKDLLAALGEDDDAVSPKTSSDASDMSDIASLAEELPSAHESSPAIAPAALQSARPSAPLPLNPSKPSTSIVGPDTPVSAPISTGTKGLDPTVLAYLQAKQNAGSSHLANDIGSAISQGVATMTNTRPNTELYAQLNQQADQPANNIVEAQQLSGMQQKLKQNQLALSEAEELNDPNSPVAKSYKAFAEKSMPGVGFDKMTPQQIASFIKNTTPLVHAQLMAKITQMKASDTKATKSTNEQLKATSELTNKAEQTKSRGATKNAWAAQLQADNAMDIIHDIETNPNMDTVQMSALLSKEVDKMASGGATTESGQKDVRPPETLRSKIANEWSKISNNPTNANLKNFATQIFKPYLIQLKENSAYRIGEGLNALKTGYKGRLTPEQLADFDSSYGEYMDIYNNRKSGKSAVQSSPGSTPNAQFTPDVVAYAQKHGISPEQALQIKMQRTGGQ